MKRLALGILVIIGCGTTAPKSDIPDECNPLGGQGCFLPWPSMAFTATDTTTPTGIKLALPANGMPTNTMLAQVDPAPWNRWDGFSPAGFALAAFPNGVGSGNLPPFTDPTVSLGSDSPIILLDMTSGTRVPFFAEVDQNISAPFAADLIIRPLARLQGGHRIAVAIRNTVKDPNGSDLPVPQAFEAIVDGTTVDHPLFATLAARYKDIFAALATQGVDKSELVLAWDYVTASDQFLTGDLSAMRTQALPAIGTNGSNLTFNGTAQPLTADASAIYYGTFTSPNFLTDGENQGSSDDSRLNRDASGAPLMNGMRMANYAAFIPKCVTAGSGSGSGSAFPLPRPTVIFGHGLFGTGQSYINDQSIQNLAEQMCVNFIAGDFIGLTSRQLSVAVLAATDLNNVGGLTEMLPQAVIDFISLENLAHGAMATSPEFMVNGQPVIDTSKIFYVGASLGGIMGSVIMAYDPNLQRAVLGVPGGNWSLLFERSNAWADLKGVAMGSYDDPADYQLGIALLAMGMEPYDPITTASHVLQNPLFGNPVKNILEWYTDGDCLVSNITTEEMARETGLTLLGPSVNMPFGLPPTPGPLVNGIVAFNDHPTPLPPTTNVPPAQDNGTHAGINSKPAALRFAQTYLLDDTMIDECFDGSDAVACDCQGAGSPCN